MFGLCSGIGTWEDKNQQEKLKHLIMTLCHCIWKYGTCVYPNDKHFHYICFLCSHTISKFWCWSWRMITNMVARLIAPIPSEAFAFLSLNQFFFLETLLIFFSWVDGTKFPFGVLESGRLLESSFTCRRDMFTSHFPSRKTSKFLFCASNRILSRSGHFTHVPKRLPSSDNICSKILWKFFSRKRSKGLSNIPLR